MAARKTALHGLGGQNLLDKAIAYVSPKLALQRLQQRSALAMTGGYTGARTDLATLSRFRPTAGSPDTDIIPDLPTLRARSRDQMRNAAVAVGALNQTVSSVVGTGLSHSASIEAEFLGLTQEQADAWQQDVNRRFKAWGESPDCDVSRTLNFYGLQELFFRSWLESGDCFALTPLLTRGGVENLALQLVEADRVCNPHRQPMTDTLIDGVELSAATREPLFYHVARRHPGKLGSANTWDRVAARGGRTGRRNVLHGFKPLRPGQVRGVPWIAPILEPLKQLGRWTDSELNAAVVSSFFSVFIKMDPEAFHSVFDDDAKGQLVDQASNWSGEMESGKAVNLLPGESVETSTPGRPNPEFDPFWQAMVRQIGVALELPFEVLVMHFQSSYSAARGALLMAWKFWRNRRELLASTFCQPVYELWLEHEVAQGRINAPGMFASSVVKAAWCAGVWTGDGPGSLDPQKEVAAAKERVALGISTKQAESILHDGVDWEVKHRQRVKETNAERRDGIYMAPPGSAAAEPVPASGSNSDAVTSNDDASQIKQPNATPADASLSNALAIVAAMRSMATPQSVAPNVINLQTSQIDEQMTTAIGAMQEAFVKQIADIQQTMPINIHMPDQPVPVVNVHPAITVDAPAVHFEATMPAPQVMINGPSESVQTVERDKDDEIVRTITKHAYQNNGV